MCSLLIFDMLGSFTGFRIKGHHRIRSNLGGFFTLFSIIAAIVTICFFGNMYISKKEVSQINNVKKYWNSQNFTVTDRFKFAVTNKYLGEIDMRQDFWRMEAYYVVYNVKDYTFKETKINSYNCTKDEWTNVEDQFDFLSLNKAYCYDVLGYELSGNTNTEIFNSIKIKYSLNIDINDLTSEWNTQMQKEIATLMPVSTFYFKEGVFEISGESTEPTYYINSISINLTYSNVKELDIAISDDELIINEDKIIVSTPRKKSAYVVSQAQEKISVRASTQTNTLAIQLRASAVKNILNINFMTFSEMLARIGGIVQNLFAILFLINYLKNYWEYEMTMYNDIFKRIENDALVSKNYEIPRKLFWDSNVNIVNNSKIGNIPSKTNVLKNRSLCSLNKSNVDKNKESKLSSNLASKLFKLPDDQNKQEASMSNSNLKMINNINTNNMDKHDNHNIIANTNQNNKEITTLKNTSHFISSINQNNLINYNKNIYSCLESNNNKELNNNMESKTPKVTSKESSKKFFERGMNMNMHSSSRQSNNNEDQNSNSNINRKKFEYLHINCVNKELASIKEENNNNNNIHDRNISILSKNSNNKLGNYEHSMIYPMINNHNNSAFSDIDDIRLKSSLKEKQKRNVINNVTPNVINNNKMTNYKVMKGIEEINEVNQTILKAYTKQTDYYKSIELISKQKKKNSQNLMRFSFCEYFTNKYIFEIIDIKKCCKKARQKKNLYIIINKYLDDALEISNLEKIYFEFNSFKYFSLSSEQLKLFENLPILPTYQIIRNMEKQKNIGFSITDTELLMKSKTDMSLFDYKLNSLFLGTDIEEKK